MKVLQLGPYPPPQGGVQTNLVAIRNYLLHRNIPCAVMNLTRFRRPDTDEVYYPKSALEVLKLLWRLPYDIAHLHIGGNLNPHVLGLALCCSLMPGRKSVLTFHSGGYPSSPEGKSARYWTLRGFVFRRFDRIIAVNAEILELFKRFGVPAHRLRLIFPHALPACEPVVRLPEKLQAFFDAHRPVLLTVGLLEPEYDLPLQIDVLGLVREQFPDAGLAIIGSGSLETDLHGRIQSKAYAEHVLLAGDVPHGETLRAIADCDLFLRTTLYDGDAVSVREALHLGSPVIASDNGMRPAGVHLIPKADLDALRRAIEQHLSSPAPRIARGELNQENLQAVLDLYNELMPGIRETEQVKMVN